MPAHVRVALAALLAAACVDLARPPEILVTPGVPDGSQPGPNRDSGMSETGGSQGGGAPGGSGPDANLPDAMVMPNPMDAPVSPPDVPIATPDTPPPLLNNGMVCTAATACASGLCVDGVCCNSACTGVCEACNLTGTRGACTPVPTGEDPGEECLQDPVSGCGRDGTCNGGGQCRLYLSGTQCGAPSCQGSTESSARLCDGMGTCKAGTSRSCAPSVCKNDSCASACAGATDCQTGYYCASGSCTVKRTAGAACTATEQCASGFCADGYCCNSACTGTCSACNLPGALGNCAAIPDGQDPANECQAQAASTCGRVGECNGARACRLFSNTTICSTASCTGSTATAAGKCDGAGTCIVPAGTSCGAYVCSGSACGTSCSGDAQCKSGHGCTSGTCVLLKIVRLTVFDTAHASSWSIQRNFQIGSGGAHPWVDWAASYIQSMDTSANRLLGKEWIKLAAESKVYTGGPQAEIALSAASDVYLVADDRFLTNATWINGWTDTGWNLIVWETPTLSFPFSLYRKTGQTGTVSLPAIGRVPGYNYFVIVD
ncbi:MAG TPA: hypothetical protein VGG33_08815 [Polyangia bacterium]